MNEMRQNTERHIVTVAWARPISDPPTDHVYHWVRFGSGPNRGETVAACGLVARFYPRVGIRMEDRHCQPCQTACVGE